MSNQLDQQNSNNAAQDSSGPRTESPHSAPERHPLATAWDTWRESTEGLHCSAPNSALGHAPNTYLENRLHRAFDAGAVAAEAIYAPLLRELYNYQQRISSPDTRWGLPLYERARAALALARGDVLERETETTTQG